MFHQSVANWGIVVGLDESTYDQTHFQIVLNGHLVAEGIFVQHNILEKVSIDSMVLIQWI